MAKRLTFAAIGTQWEIRVTAKLSAADWEQLRHAIDTRINEFDSAYSRFREDSLVGKMAREAGTYHLPPDGHKMLTFYKQLYEVTDGKVTPLIGQTISDAGYDATYSLRSKRLHKPPRWEDVIEHASGRITLKQPALLDFGAAGKGYLVDILGDLIQQAGVTSFLINAGGDILNRSSHLDVGLQNPFDPTEVIGITKLGAQSLCASAGNKRHWGKFHHIIDPDKLASPRLIAATWVVADDTMTADGLATALFFTDAEVLRQYFDFEFGMLRSDMRFACSPNFPVKLFEAA